MFVKLSSEGRRIMEKGTRLILNELDLIISESEEYINDYGYSSKAARKFFKDIKEENSKSYKAFKEINSILEKEMK